MRALQLTAAHQLEIVDRPEPTPGAGEVIVTLRAAALNRRDVWIKAGQYAGAKWPCIPGSDGAGVVAACGEGVDARWLGRDVIINPSLGWGDREAAQGPQFAILGVPHSGTFAEKIAVPETQLAAKPPHLSWEEAGALPLAGLTAYRAIFSRAKLLAGERILISGIGGGVALFALQLAVAAEAECWVTSGADEKISRAMTMGAAGGFNYRQAGWAASAKARGPFDVIIDSAGGDGFESLIDLAAPGGRLVFFGATHGNPSGVPLRKIFWRQLSVLGATMGSPADWEAMTAFVTAHRMRPVVSDVFTLARATEAFALMERGEQFGKIVVTLESR